jgi:hypothetical protein
LIPLDYKKNGQITDDTLYELLVGGFKKGVYVTCLIDCCHSGSVLDLPHVFTANAKSSGKKVQSGGKQGKGTAVKKKKKKEVRPRALADCTIL